MGLLDEKDYIMRLIREMVSVLFSLMLGKQYKSVELENENKYEVSGKTLEDFKTMVDQGLINEAEDMLLENLDYARQEDVCAAILFYKYVGEAEADFLARHDYSKEEVLDGLKMLAEKAGYGEMSEIFPELY